jgi:thiamine-monophosphate kinase
MTISEQRSDTRTLMDVGERFIKSRIIDRLQKTSEISQALIGGLGHDAGVLENPLNPDDTLLVNTDRSGVNKAYNLGLAGGECIGDFAVSHAVSDILATGGTPFGVSIALLLPGETTVSLVDEIMDGVKQACLDYGVTLTGGDTKKAESLSLVVTALGKAPVANLLYRNTPRVGDHLVVSGQLGSMLLGSVVHKRRHRVSGPVQKVIDGALIKQRPPFRLGIAMSESRLAHACTDISDGLQAACRNMLTNTNLGIQLSEMQIPIHPELKDLASSLSLTPLQLSMAGGDWQFLYCVPENHISALKDIAERSNTPLTVIGEVTDEVGIWVKTVDGERKKLRDIEHDSFQERVDGKSYFDFLSDPQELFE